MLMIEMYNHASDILANYTKKVVQLTGTTFEIILILSLKDGYIHVHQYSKTRYQTKSKI